MSFYRAYYSNDVSWGGVELDKATQFTHKEAITLANRLNGPLKLKAEVRAYNGKSN